MTPTSTRAVVIGGGFFGAMIALRASAAGVGVTLLEREDRLMTRASLINQARIHGGYHYPRGYLTARRSRVNFTRYLADFPETVIGDITHLYAVPRFGSKVSPAQFVAFCRRIEAPIDVAPPVYKRMFEPSLVEAVWLVQEAVFDADSLREVVKQRLLEAGVDVQLECSVASVERLGSRLQVTKQGVGAVACDTLDADLVFDCTYANLNGVRERSGLPPLPLKIEQAEIAVIAVPPVLSGVAVTVMDGPFFSVMPFPPAKAHSLTHVRYTPRLSVTQGPRRPTAHVDMPAHVGLQPTDRAAIMLRDARRFLRPLRDAALRESWIEQKAVLVASESDDSRPILMDRNRDLPGYVSVLGSKIDNVYDVLDAVEGVLAGVVA